ncbi:MAG: hypothetical protein JNL62_17725, partial [Bryobacterales bacterium]|nr:hypothetical protein [Bryobacterales bacterium]
AVRAWLQPSLAPALPVEERGDWGLKFRSLKAVFLPLFIVFLVLGAIFGGGKGAATGAGAGGAAGAGTVLATRGKPVVLPAETRISFRLSQPVTIIERR